METKKVYKHGEDIVIVIAETDGCGGRKYVAVTADIITPLAYTEAVERNREYLEDGELWKDAVSADRTELGLADWVEMVINYDGETSLIDNSLYAETITINDEDYIFDSVGCGCQHDLIQSITHTFDRLIDLHLNDNEEAVKEAENIIMGIPQDDIDEKISRIAKRIVKERN